MTDERGRDVGGERTGNMDAIEIGLDLWDARAGSERLHERADEACQGRGAKVVSAVERGYATYLRDFMKGGERRFTGHRCHAQRHGHVAEERGGVTVAAEGVSRRGQGGRRPRAAYDRAVELLAHLPARWVSR
jgi:hypothetical protein